MINIINEYWAVTKTGDCLSRQHRDQRGGLLSTKPGANESLWFAAKRLIGPMSNIASADSKHSVSWEERFEKKYQFSVRTEIRLI